MKSWLNISADSDFSIANIPFGVYKSDRLAARVGCAIGDQIIDLKVLHVLGYLENLPFELSDLESPSLNAIIAHGKGPCQELRMRVQKLLRSDVPDLQRKEHHVAQVLIPQADATMCMPVEIGDYTDFYSSEQHARNVGMMFRDPDNALLPNWKHMPVAYHGRASSVVVSGTPVRRPSGQLRPDPEKPPVFGKSRLLDFELEMGFITHPGKPLGEAITTAQAEEFIFGLVLFNDWSARDIQKWEYVPLGPFLGKNFASSVSPWVVTLDALDDLRVAGPVQEPAVLPYLEYEGHGHYNVGLEVDIVTPDGVATTISRSNLRHMYWNMNQQLAHHTVNGCNIRGGDLLASGTISGETPESYGSMLELSWRGTKEVKLADGSLRKFIADGDTVVMRGHGVSAAGDRIGFGSVSGTVTCD
jgi:fumarylacetoacetase